MRRRLNDLKLQVFGIDLNVRRVVALAVSVCLLILVAFAVAQVLGEEETTELVPDNKTGRYPEKDPNWGLCVAFVFLAVVMGAVIVVEVSN